MTTETYSWVSRHTGTDMVVVRYGERGRPLVYVPTSEGDHREFCTYGFPEVARPWIDMGRTQVFAIDGWGPRSWFDDGLAPVERVRRYACFEKYSVEELLPWVAAVSGRADVAAMGASYGAMVCANWILKHPGKVGLACGFGGVYGLWHRLAGYHDLDVYYHTPLEYLPRLDDPAILSAIRATSGLDLFAAVDDPWFDSSERLRIVLQDKGIPHRWDVWPSPADHHENWWAEQLRAFLERRFGT